MLFSFCYSLHLHSYLQSFLFQRSLVILICEQYFLFSYIHYHTEEFTVHLKICLLFLLSLALIFIFSWLYYKPTSLSFSLSLQFCFLLCIHVLVCTWLARLLSNIYFRNKRKLNNDDNEYLSFWCSSYHINVLVKSLINNFI